MNSPLPFDHFKTEKGVFAYISENRAHRSFLTGEPLEEDLRAWNFAHVLPKRRNAYPRFKFYEKNIVLLTYDEHAIWDRARGKIDVNAEPKWLKLIALERALKIEYRQLNRGIKF